MHAFAAVFLSAFALGGAPSGELRDSKSLVGVLLAARRFGWPG